MTTKKEAVFYTRQHTITTENITVDINDIVLKEMLTEELSENVKNELIQAYYVALLFAKLKITGKHTYGSWNGCIAQQGRVYCMMSDIANKLKNNVTKTEVEDQCKLINNLLGLSDSEINNSKPIQVEVLTAFNILN